MTPSAASTIASLEPRRGDSGTGTDPGGPPMTVVVFAWTDAGTIMAPGWAAADPMGACAAAEEISSAAGRVSGGAIGADGHSAAANANRVTPQITKVISKLRIWLSVR